MHPDQHSTDLPALFSEQNLAPNNLILSGTCNFYGKEIEFELIDHHYAHLVSAFARYPEASIAISLDGSGGAPSKSLCVPTWGGMSAVRHGNQLRIGPLPLFKGGILYSTIARGMGLSEGKLMGLSSYFKMSSQADENIINKFNELIEKFCHSLESEILFSDTSRSVMSKDVQNHIDKKWFEKVSHDLGPLVVLGRELFDLDSSLKGTHQSNNIKSLPPIDSIIGAGVVQKIFVILRQRCIDNQIQFLVEYQQKRQHPNVVLTGGCTLNCPSNMKSATSGKANFYFDNACNDEGLSIGSVLASDFAISPDSVISNSSKTEFLNSPYLGSHVTGYKEALSLVKESQHLMLINGDIEELAKQIANILSLRKIVIVARGRYEAGPRALGARSLIGIAQDIRTHYFLNEIKGLEQWRPIAPAIRDEDFHRYFQGPMNSHMLMTNHVIDDVKIPAVTHIDNSARVQVVANPKNSFWPILGALKEKGLHPVIANTSLNVADEPLINSATRAIRLMEKNLETIHAVWFDDFLVVRK